MNIQFRVASFADWEGIADIHILSWQENYRGIFTDDFLDHDIYKNRKEIWHDRFQNPPNNHKYRAYRGDRPVVRVRAMGHVPPLAHEWGAYKEL